MFDNQLEKLKNAKLEIQDDTLLITCDKYMVEMIKKLKMDIQNKYSVTVYAKKDLIRVKGNEVKKETFCDVLNYTFGNDKEKLTLDEFDNILAKSSTEENTIKRRRSYNGIHQINNIIPQSGSTSILSRKLSDLGENPEPIDYEENPKCDSFLHSHKSTPIATLGSDQDDHISKPKEFIPQKVSTMNSSTISQSSSSTFYNNAIKSQPSSPKREPSYNQNSYKNRNQTRNNKPLERRATVSNCYEFSPKNYNPTSKPNYNPKTPQYRNYNKNTNQNNNNKNTYNPKNRSQMISFYSSNNTKNPSDESSDSISTEPEANIDHCKYYPRSYSPPMSSITSSIATSRSTNILLHRSKPNGDLACNVEYKINGNNLVFKLTESNLPATPNKRSSQQILTKIYETLGFNSQVSFNKIFFKC